MRNIREGESVNQRLSFLPGVDNSAAPNQRNLETDLDAANKLYAQNKFAEAATAVEKLIQGGSVSPALYFKLGNAHFKSGQIGRAVAAYQQAAVLSPRDPDIRANLQFARNQVQGPTVRPGFFQRALGTLSLNEWTWLGVASLWITFGLLILRQLKPNLTPALRIWILLAALTTLALGAGTGAALAVNPAGHIVVVTTRETTVRNSPFEESPAVFTVNDGAELRVVDHKNDWVQVMDGAKRFGWLKREVVFSL
jgi:tetratricopeptide (TPR) repeat protein